MSELHKYTGVQKTLCVCATCNKFIQSIDGVCNGVCTCSLLIRPENEDDYGIMYWELTPDQLVGVQDTCLWSPPLWTPYWERPDDDTEED